MVLDCVKEIGNKLFFIFKNTYKNDKQVKIEVGMEFNIFILILNNYLRKPTVYNMCIYFIKQSLNLTKDAQNAPLEFYYVHIDFDGKP